jgi:CRISPR-associated protein Cas6
MRMFWHEDKNPDEVQIPNDIVDLLFAIECKCIPVDHAYLLATALQTALPWLATEPALAVHSIHGAGSQNGWNRPAFGTETELLLSRRTKLIIRAPQQRVAELLQHLPGVTLDLAAHPLTVGAGKIRALTKEATLLARHVVTGDTTADNADEQEFLAAAARELAALGIPIRKALCGKATALTTPTGLIQTRSLLLAALTAEDSIQLQQRGIGPHRLLGCGIFIPHKGIDSVKNG